MAIPTSEQYGEVDGVLAIDPTYGLAVVVVARQKINLRTKLRHRWWIVQCGRNPCE